MPRRSTAVTITILFGRVEDRRARDNQGLVGRCEMSCVITTPEMMTSAALDLATIGANVNAAHLVAAPPTVAVVPAAADEVSAAIASVFANHAEAFQGLAGKAAAFNDQFVQTLKSGGAAYAATEATSAASLRPLNAAAGIQSAELLLEGLLPLLGISLFLLFLVFGWLLLGLITLPFLPLGMLNMLFYALPYGLPFVLASFGI